MKWIFMIMLAALSCNSTKNISESENVESNTSLQNEMAEIEIDGRLKIDEKDLNFQLKEVVLNGSTLIASVQYGGGCVKPHIFKLKTTGVINEDGFMRIWLLHKTYDDLCKALLMEDVTFDLSVITSKTSSKMKGFIVNDKQKIYTIEK